MAKLIRKIAAFDFDHTIINVNSDIYVDKMVILKDDQLDDKSKAKKSYKYPTEIDQLRETKNWTYRMDAVFQYMHDRFRISSNDIVSCMREIEIDRSMIDLIKSLAANSYELIIISDSNTIFIDEILKQNAISDCFAAVYTNTAYVEDNGRLRVRPFNEEFGGSIDRSVCTSGMCTSNICKGSILKHHLSKKQTFKQEDTCSDHLIYFGDGTNDFCPGLFLGKGDQYFVRKNFSLFKLLNSDQSLASRLNTNVLYWSDASDILTQLNFS